MRFAPVGQIPKWLAPACARLPHLPAYLSKNSKNARCRKCRSAKWSSLRKSRTSLPSCALQPATRLPAKPLASAVDQHRHSAVHFAYFVNIVCVIVRSEFQEDGNDHQFSSCLCCCACATSHVR